MGSVTNKLGGRVMGWGRSSGPIGLVMMVMIAAVSLVFVIREITRTRYAVRLWSGRTHIEVLPADTNVSTTQAPNGRMGGVPQ